MAAASTYQQLTSKYTWGKPGVIHAAKPWHERCWATILTVKEVSKLLQAIFKSISIRLLL